MWKVLLMLRKYVNPRNCINNFKHCSLKIALFYFVKLLLFIFTFFSRTLLSLPSAVLSLQHLPLSSLCSPLHRLFLFSLSACHCISLYLDKAPPLIDSLTQSKYFSFLAQILNFLYHHKICTTQCLQGFSFICKGNRIH